MKEAKVEYDDIADMHWWMVDHIHYLPAMIYAVLLIDIVSIVVIIKLSKGLGQDEILERLNPNRSLENGKKLFLMTAIRKTALHILDLQIFANFTTKKSIYSDAKLRHKVRK